MKLKVKTHNAYKKDIDSLTQGLNLKSVPKIHAGPAVYLYERGSSWGSHWDSMGTIGRSVIFPVFPILLSLSGENWAMFHIAVSNLQA